MSVKLCHHWCQGRESNPHDRSGLGELTVKIIAAIDRKMKADSLPVVIRMASTMRDCKLLK